MSKKKMMVIFLSVILGMLLNIYVFNYIHIYVPGGTWDSGVFAIIIDILLCLVIDGLIVTCAINSAKLAEIPREVLKNRRLVMSLSKNDFKTKFAGSYLGIIWAFIQPVITVLVYWFVFQFGLRNTPVYSKEGIEVPFVLWLIAGLVPWFFFSEALNSGTNALIEYNYLVKKVVFKISILPVVKVIAALFVHFAFLAFTIFLYAMYGFTPDLYTLQTLYYTLCMIVLILGICYATCSIVVFFRDLTQIISIILQVGVWMTPIMWNIDSMEGKISPVIIMLLKLNPMYYVVSGYRNAFISKIWFWEQMPQTIYFWCVAAACFVLGTIIFNRLKVHFADVL